MKYFLVEQDKLFIHAPQAVNWFDKIEPDKMHKDTQLEIPFRAAVSMKSDENVQFIDVLSYPVFSVSEMIYKVIKMYEPNMIWKELMLYDAKTQNASLYYVPILDDVDCLTEKCVFNLDKSKLEKIQINEGKIRDKSIFQLAGVKTRYVVMRLDLVESLLRREVIGMNLDELDVINEEK